MALLVYITKECQEDAQDHAFESEVIKFRDRILQEQRVTLFDNFPPPYLKKRFIRQLRLIAAERRNGDHVVVCFCRLLVRALMSQPDHETAKCARSIIVKRLHERIHSALPRLLSV